MTVTWTAPAKVLTDRADPGWEGIWTLTHAAGRAALNLADALPLIDALDVIYAATDLRDAQDHLERADPGLPARCAAVDLGPLAPADGTPQARLIIDQLTTAALARVERMTDTDMSIDKVLTLGDAASALRRARDRVTGRRHD